MIEILFLGTSTATHTKTRNHPGVLLRYENKRILFDCGECIQKQLLYTKESPMSIDYVFITHFHGDHVFGLPGLIESMSFLGRERELTVVGPEGIKRYIVFITDWQKLDPSFQIKVREVKPGDKIDENTFHVSVFKTKHTKESLGYRFQENDRINLDKEKLKDLGLYNSPLCKELKEFGEIRINGRKILLSEVSTVSKGDSVVYTGDTAPSQDIINASKNATLLIHDSSFTQELEKKAIEYNHSTCVQAAQVAKEAGVKYLVLTNISPRFEKEEDRLLKQAKEIFENTIVARDFMKLQIKKGELNENTD